MVVVMLVAVKALRAGGLFLAVDLLHDDGMPVVLYVWLVMAGAAALFLTRQRPWGTGCTLLRVRVSRWL